MYPNEKRSEDNLSTLMRYERFPEKYKYFSTNENATLKSIFKNSSKKLTNKSRKNGTFHLIIFLEYIIFIFFKTGMVTFIFCVIYSYLSFCKFNF